MDINDRAHAIARLKAGASAEMIVRELVDRRVTEDDARTTLAELDQLKLDAARAEAHTLIAKGLEWPWLRAAIRKRGLSEEEAESLLARVRPAYAEKQKAHENSATAKAAEEHEFAAFTRASERRQNVAFCATLLVGLVFIGFAVLVEIVSTAGGNIAPTGLALIGGLWIIQAFARRSPSS